MRTRYVATLRIELDAESVEARDFVLHTIAEGMNAKRPGATFPDVGTAQVRKASVGRVRQMPRRKKR